MLSVLEILKITTGFFAAKGIDNARLNAELLIGHSLGLKRMQLYLQFERLLTGAELDRLRPLVRRRAQREPLQYVTGEVEWGGLRLKIDRRALIPRAETELLLEIIPGALGAESRVSNPKENAAAAAATAAETAAAGLLPGGAPVPGADEGRHAPRQTAGGGTPSVSPRDAGAPQSAATAGRVSTVAADGAAAQNAGVDGTGGGEVGGPESKSLSISEKPLAILDLGTGSGALALGLATVFPGARVTALDVSAEALALARENAVLCGLDARVRFARSDWFSALRDGPVETPGGFDVIVANPPYLSAAEVAESAPEVREFEPRAALASADEGRADLAKIIAGAPEFLREGGLLALETGIAQHPALLARCAAAGFARCESRKDLAGRDRFVLAWR
ncbi:MAG: peptide chain release factor N(5)-glutamine methyltransferase [Opitutaceae bacterium]|nr:peptide chain release factor N(5)-glutamine methyltransferase [Opitutaceae bacterium]